MLAAKVRQTDEVASIHGHDHCALTTRKVEDVVVRRPGAEHSDLDSSLGRVTGGFGDLDQRLAAALVKQQVHASPGVAGSSAGRAWA